jgi:DNA-binding CsgD family transcriptional regulator
VAWLSEIGGAARSVPLTPSDLVRLGRSDDNDVVLADDLKVSRRHAELTCRQGKWWLRDCRSRNGTLVNGTAIDSVELAEGDRVRLGSYEFVFSAADDPLATVDDASAVPPELPSLSKREREILAWVASGATDFQIARALGIEVTTVHSHLDRIRDKTGRRRRPDLTRLATELGLAAAGSN